jgi:hypothetical protein
VAVRLAFASTCLIASSTAIAADMLSLRRGIYVVVGTPCKGASNADTMSYWGGDNGLNVAREACRIRKMNRQGSRYTLWRKCQSNVGLGGSFSDRIQVKVVEATSFAISGRLRFPTSELTYRYCGPKVES